LGGDQVLSRGLPQLLSLRHAAHRSASRNYLVTHHPKLGILDFGSIRVFPEPLRRSYLRLARALIAADRDEIAAACRALDFIGDGDSPKR